MRDLFEYRRELDGLRFTQEQKAALAARAAQAVSAGERRPARRPVRRMALVAAALAAVLVVGAGATGMLKPVADVFGPLFGGGTAQTEIIDKIGRPIGASAGAGGVTITADAIIGDRYNACVVYSISRDDGQPFRPEAMTANELGYLPLHFKSQWTDLRFNGGGSHGSAYFTDSDPTDNAVQYVETLSTDEPLKMGAAKATFQDLCWFNDATGELVPLAEGEWVLRFDVDYEDSSVSLPAGQTFTQDGMTFTITAASVSPVAVRVDYTVDSEMPGSDGPSGRLPEEDRNAQARYFENVEILLTKADGTVVDVSLSGGGMHPRDGKTYCTKGEVLEEIIPLEDMVSLTVGGVELPIRAD